MALVSPGISITINDQSQYVNSNIGSVPFVLLATAQNKKYNGTLATGTTKANAGQLMSFTSQRDLVTAMGTPTFQLTSSGTPINASELNEYGLMAAYSALGISNQLYAIRADIDLDELHGTSVRPVSAPTDGQLWLDTVNSDFGIYELDQTTSPASFKSVAPLIITDKSQVELDSSFSPTVVSRPKRSVGTTGSYAIPAVVPAGTTPSTLRLFYKATGISTDGSSGTLINQWVQVNSPDWQRSHYVAKSAGTISGLVGGASGSDTRLTINGTNITATDLGGTSASLSASTVESVINAKAIAGVFARTVSGVLYLFCTSAAKSNGSVVDGSLIVGGALGTSTTSGIRITGQYWSPNLFYGNYASEPSGGWGIAAADAVQRPSGSIWWKIGSTGGGLSLVYKAYSATTGNWQQLSVPAYPFFSDAVYGLDPIGGGTNISAGTPVVTYGLIDNTYNTFRLNGATGGGPTVITAGTFDPNANIANGNTFTLRATAPGTATQNNATVTIGGTGTINDVVAAILSAQVPYIAASVTSSNTIQLTHTAGGIVQLIPITSGILASMGFTATGGTGYTVNGGTGVVQGVHIQNQTNNTAYQSSTPYNSPVDGTHWYYSSPSDVDIMINTGTQWKGYQAAGTDIRNFDLTQTDPDGVIVSASRPTSQSDGSALVSGDLWLDSSDLINYPKLLRFSATSQKWTAIDNTDHVTSNGIIFADARWDMGGTTNVTSDALPSTSNMLLSNYVDLDCPDPTLYARGTLLFNTRRSGYNVKKFVQNYFNNTTFDPTVNVGKTNGFPVSFPAVTDTWVTASGLDDNNVMNAGSAAQRAIVVAAMKGAIDSSVTAREDTYPFNLVVAPGYPELIPNLVSLNNDRANTGFVIGDTPLTLEANAIDIFNWNNNSDGKGLATADAYLGVYYPSGRTNDLEGNSVVVPASHAVLRTFLYNDNVSYPWFAPAGTHRGLISNLSDIGYVDKMSGEWVHQSINQGLRDALYSHTINPLCQLPGVGLVVWGQITKSGSSSARDRVNVVRLENFLRVAFKSLANAYLFEPNDVGTRKSIARAIEGTLHDVLSKRGLYDFLVICDSSNNTSNTIANNQLFVDVAIEPVRDVEFIYIPIAIYNPGQIATVG